MKPNCQVARNTLLAKLEKQNKAGEEVEEEGDEAEEEGAEGEVDPFAEGAVEVFEAAEAFEEAGVFVAAVEGGGDGVDAAALDVILEVDDLVFHFMDACDETGVAVGAAQGAMRFLAEGGEMVYGFGEGGELEAELARLSG